MLTDVHLIFVTRSSGQSKGKSICMQIGFYSLSLIHSCALMLVVLEMVVVEVLEGVLGGWGFFG